MNDEAEVVDAELVADALPAVLADPAAVLAGVFARPVVTQHTVLRPGEIPTTERPAYTAADFYVSEETARAIDEQARPENTDRNYRSQRGMFERWWAEMGRVAVPCTTATYIEYIAALTARGKYSPNTLKAHKSAVRSMQPEDAKPGTAVVNGLIKEYAKSWNKRNRVKKAPAIPDDKFRAMRFSQRRSSPGVVEDEGGLGDGADAAGTEGDALERAPALLELGRGPFTQRPHAAQECVIGAGVWVKLQVRAIAGFLERVVGADAGTLVAGVGEGGQPVGGRLVQGRQAVGAGGGDVRY